jgi:sirohydrochlorin ferrochelatase
VTQFSSWPIARKLAALCLGFGLMPVALIATIICRQSSTTVRERAAERLQEAAGHVADKIDRNLFERYGDVQAFGFNEVVLDRTQWYRPGAETNRIAERMNAYVAAYGVYLTTEFVDAQGRLRRARRWPVQRSTRPATRRPHGFAPAWKAATPNAWRSATAPTCRPPAP